MEQVFEQVSQLLGKHPATRQRKLHIRTYKVLPLSAHSGIMEFVQNTIPLSDYLQPAHRSYYPNDISWNECRTRLHNITQQSTDVNARVKVFKEVISKFHPVMRYFFLERFDDPDDWFAKRLAYTRATAAISILGHILGLGDRHCHNILLDQKTGEAVHIDLGIAFEAGRILPMPEVIPFRLTRDLIDAMGYTKTEGVFRRCCEFTLEALRDERESIMTLLNVLRYDPLVNWTVSPLRAKRMQDLEAAERDDVFDDLSSAAAGPKSKDDGGHAGRALSVVEKKLSKTLSIAATVSELIHQATDERNLAVLYPGKLPRCACSIVVVGANPGYRLVGLGLTFFASVPFRKFLRQLS
jgi:ataxia telangiectasia mutated family protein